MRSTVRDPSSPRAPIARTHAPTAAAEDLGERVRRVCSGLALLDLEVSLGERVRRVCRGLALLDLEVSLGERVRRVCRVCRGLALLDFEGGHRYRLVRQSRGKVLSHRCSQETSGVRRNVTHFSWGIPADGRGELSLLAPRSRAGIENGNLVVSLARRRSDLSFYFPERGNSPPFPPLPSASAESSRLRLLRLLRLLRRPRRLRLLRRLRRLRAPPLVSALLAAATRSLDIFELGLLPLRLLIVPLLDRSSTGVDDGLPARARERLGRRVAVHRDRGVSSASSPTRQTRHLA